MCVCVYRCVVSVTHHRCEKCKTCKSMPEARMHDWEQESSRDRESTWFLGFRTFPISHFKICPISTSWRTGPYNQMPCAAVQPCRFRYRLGSALLDLVKPWRLQTR